MLVYYRRSPASAPSPTLRETFLLDPSWLISPHTHAARFTRLSMSVSTSAGPASMRELERVLHITRRDADRCSLSSLNHLMFLRPPAIMGLFGGKTLPAVAGSPLQQVGSHYPLLLSLNSISNFSVRRLYLQTPSHGIVPRTSSSSTSACLSPCFLRHRLVTMVRAPRVEDNYLVELHR